MSMLKRICLIGSNVAMMSMWARVVYIFYVNGWGNLINDEEDVCSGQLRPALLLALGVSALELLNSLLGLTRSKPQQVFLFASVRLGVELWLTPLVSCGAWQHLWTALCWSTGEVVRFGCFALDGMLPEVGAHVKSIRYTVGPILFPLGAGGEMLMVIRAAMDGRPVLYGAAALWPLGFYPLFTQLLKQRRKHFQKIKQDRKTD